jgi:hypothetical protein
MGNGKKALAQPVQFIGNGLQKARARLWRGSGIGGKSLRRRLRRQCGLLPGGRIKTVAGGLAVRSLQAEERGFAAGDAAPGDKLPTRRHFCFAHRRSPPHRPTSGSTGRVASACSTMFTTC